MQYPCHRCGALVEDGARFCPACAAPQIRVPRQAAPEPSLSPAPEDIPPLPLLPALQSSPSALNWKHGWPAVLIAGGAMAILSGLPLLDFVFPVWMIGAGVLAVSIYLQRSRLSGVRAGLGAKLGAAAGAIAGFLYAALFTTVTLLPQNSEPRSQLRDRFAQQMQGVADPQAKAMLQWFLTPPGFKTLVLIGAAMTFIGFVLVAMASGALWARIRRPR